MNHDEEVLTTYYLKDECGTIWHGEWASKDDAMFFAKSANLSFLGTSANAPLEASKGD